MQCARATQEEKERKGFRAWLLFYAVLRFAPLRTDPVCSVFVARDINALRRVSPIVITSQRRARDYAMIHVEEPVRLESYQFTLNVRCLMKPFICQA